MIFKRIRFHFDNYEIAITELPSGTYILDDRETIIMTEKHIEEFEDMLEDWSYYIV